MKYDEAIKLTKDIILEKVKYGRTCTRTDVDRRLWELHNECLTGTFSDPASPRACPTSLVVDNALRQLKTAKVIVWVKKSDRPKYPKGFLGCWKAAPTENELEARARRAKKVERKKAARARLLERLPPPGPNGLDLRKIAPEVHPRYSPMLFEYLTCKKQQEAGYPMALRTTGFVDPEGWFYIAEKNNGRRRVTGTGNQFVRPDDAVLVVSAMGGGKDTVPMGFLNEAGAIVAVPDFWERYMRYGRCAVDPDHTQHFAGGDKERFTLKKEPTAEESKGRLHRPRFALYRVCNWCGLRQDAHRRRVSKTAIDWQPVGHPG